MYIRAGSVFIDFKWHKYFLLKLFARYFFKTKTKKSLFFWLLVNIFKCFFCLAFIRYYGCWCNLHPITFQIETMCSLILIFNIGYRYVNKMLLVTLIFIGKYKYMNVFCFVICYNLSFIFFIIFIFIFFLIFIFIRIFS